jgi:hypothetical protein
VAASYQLQRKIRLSDAVWQTVATVSASPSNFVSVADTTATASSGYYRLQY